ncbi:MAG: cytochrome C assembly family protein [Pseudomonadales bacterium]
MITFAILLTALIYAGAAIAQLRQMRSAEQVAFWQRATVIKIASAIAVLSHTFILQQTLHFQGGIHLGIISTGSLISWLVALVLLLSSLRQKVDNLFIAVFPMAALLLVLQLLPNHSGAKHYQSGVIIHILLSILAYSIFTLATLQALLLQHQNNTLKRGFANHKSLLNSLPPLQTMERLLFEMLWTGFALLCAALISGFIFVNDIFEQHLAHKSALSICAWFVYATLLGGRIFRGWRGHIAVRGTLIGFALLMLGFFGSQLVLLLLQNNA